MCTGFAARGSSPLARGLRWVAVRVAARIRIIPARAGFTTPYPVLSSQPQDHPRSRGVYGYPADGDWRGRGSSPLARGLQPGRFGGGSSAGIIPARAGFTCALDHAKIPLLDHPRSRGVYFFPGARARMPPGSSPLARGLPVRNCLDLCHKRIIPARAGFTPSPYGAPRFHSDHPRSRGVYLTVYCIIANM